MKGEDKKKLDKDLFKFCMEVFIKVSKVEFKLKFDLVVEYVLFVKFNCKGCLKFIGKFMLCVGFLGKVNFGVIVWYYYDCVWKESVFLVFIDIF